MDHLGFERAGQMAHPVSRRIHLTADAPLPPLVAHGDWMKLGPESRLKEVAVLAKVPHRCTQGDFDGIHSHLATVRACYFLQVQ